MVNVTPFASGMQNVSIRGDPLARKINTATSSGGAAHVENAETASTTTPQQATRAQPVSVFSDSASYMSNRESSANVADAFVMLATPNSDLQQAMSQVVNAKQFAPVDSDVVANVAGLVGKMFDLGD
jgi:hypothetical protein